MAPHSSTLAWKIPWTEEPGRLRSMGSLGVRHDWATSPSLFTFMCWRRKWQPTPVFLPGESQRQQSLVGCRLWGLTESDTSEATWRQQQHRDNFTSRSCVRGKMPLLCPVRGRHGSYRYCWVRVTRPTWTVESSTLPHRGAFLPTPLSNLTFTQVSLGSRQR